MRKILIASHLIIIFLLSMTTPSLSENFSKSPTKNGTNQISETQLTQKDKLKESIDNPESVGVIKYIDMVVSQLEKREILNKVTFLEYWGILSGLASIAGFLSAFFFYWKSKKTDEVARGFFSAISAESNSVLQELNSIKQIANPDSFKTLEAKVAVAHSFMASLNHTIHVFRETLWPHKTKS